MSSREMKNIRGIVSSIVTGKKSKVKKGSSYGKSASKKKKK